MSRIRVLPIVEGQGEVESIRLLLERIWREVVGGEFIDVLQPIRSPKSKRLTNSAANWSDAGCRKYSSSDARRLRSSLT